MTVIKGMELGTDKLSPKCETRAKIRYSYNWATIMTLIKGMKLEIDKLPPNVKHIQN